MVIHDYGCPDPSCEEILFNQPSDAPPRCPVHDLQMEIRFLPKHYRPFEAFIYEEDVSGRKVEITSLNQLRDIESRSMKEYEAGEGRPVIFRGYTQDHSNRDRNVFQHLHPQVQREKLITRSRRGMPFITCKVGPPAAAPEGED